MRAGLFWQLIMSVRLCTVGRKQLGFRAGVLANFLAAAIASTPEGFPNQLAARPPRGWRSWNGWGPDINQPLVMSMMDALLDHRHGSLASLGYTDVGLDEGWAACGAGVNGTYRNGTTEHVIVDKVRFPSLSDLTAHAHFLNLTAGWYLNCDGCVTNHFMAYTPDAADALAYGFDGVKFDGGGGSDNITRWAEALNGTGKPMLIENCLDKKQVSYLLHTPAECPFNMYRVGSDVGPHFLGAMANAYVDALPFLEAVVQGLPASRPSCWAYPDMLPIGTPSWSAPHGLKRQTITTCGGELTRAEEAAIFATWSIVSSPLILGFDLTNLTEVSRLLPIIGNKRALDVNAQWAGEAGRALKRSKTSFNATALYNMDCSRTRHVLLPEWVVWSKQLSSPPDSVAALAINLADGPRSFSVTLKELALAAGDVHGDVSEMAGVEVWSGAKVAKVTADADWCLDALPSHDSAFVIFTK